MPYTKNGLVPVQKLVSRNGKQHIQTFYVSVDEAKKEGYQHHLPKKEGKDALQKLLRTVRKDMGSSEYRDMLKANGIKWDEASADGPNTMRASMAAYKFLMEGNHIDLEKTGKTVDPKLVVTVGNAQPIPSPSPTPAPSQSTPQPVPVVNVPTPQPSQKFTLADLAVGDEIEFETPTNSGKTMKKVAEILELRPAKYNDFVVVQFANGKKQMVYTRSVTGVVYKSNQNQPTPEPTPPSSQPTGQPDPSKVTQPVKSTEPPLNRLMQRLGVAYREQNGAFIIGEGHKEVNNKWGRPETAPGSIRFSGVQKAPPAQAPKWGDGHFIRLDSNFMDKDTIKTLDGKFDPDSKKWFISFKMFVEAFKTFKNIEIDPSIVPTIKTVMERVDVDSVDLSKKPQGGSAGNGTTAGGTRADKDIDITNFSLPAGIKNIDLFPHQKKGVKFLLDNKRATLGLAVGLGKTPSAIVAVKQLINDKKIKRALVIAPSSVKFNWQEEVSRFSDMSTVVLESGDLRGKKADDMWKLAENSDIIVVNYDMLRKPEIREKLQKLAPDCVIADEAHKLKNSKAQQTKGFRDAWRNAEYKFFLSATPFPNGKPQETHTILSHLRPDKVGSWTNFGRRYVVWENGSFGAKAVSLKNIDQLKDAMSDVVFMRNHNSPDVTTNLPKERHTTFSLEMNKDQKKMYKAIADDIGSEIKRLEASGLNASTPAMIAKFKKLEQVAIDPDMLLDDPSKINMSKLYPKEEWAVQTIVDHLEDSANRGVVLFCDMKLPLDKIRQGLIDEGVDPSKVAYITGSVKPEERTAVQAKMAKGDVKVVLCTNAAEEGVNLQHGAHTLIHLDQPWVPKAITQREGRVLRTGQPNPYTNFYSPIITGTVEDKKRGTIAGKVDAIEELLGAGTSGSVKNNIQADTKGKGLSLADLKSML